MNSIQKKRVVLIGLIIIAVTMGVSAFLAGFFFSEITNMPAAARLVVALLFLVSVFLLAWYAFYKAVESIVSEAQYMVRLEHTEVSAPTGFTMTREEIVERTRALKNENLVAIEKDEPQFPYSLKWKTKTFALLYGTDKGVLMIIRIPEDYAAKLGKVHEVTPAKFPKGRFWQVIPLGKTFKDKTEVYDILDKAREFVSNPPRAKK